MDGPIPLAWLPRVSMQRVHLHWTAGAHRASAFDKKHYHILIEYDGNLVKGAPSISYNKRPLNRRLPYAAHTLNANDGAIGVSLCCMGDPRVSESNYVNIRNPMTRAQWHTMIRVIAQLCEFYSIPVTPQTVLSHAEVSRNLNRPQRGKWDFTRLSFDPEVKGAKVIGDRMRRETLAIMGQKPSKVAVVANAMNDPKAEATVPAGSAGLSVAADMQGDQMIAAAMTPTDGVADLTMQLQTAAGYGLKFASYALMAIAVISALFIAGKYAVKAYRYYYPPKPNALERARGVEE